MKPMVRQWLVVGILLLVPMWLAAQEVRVAGQVTVEESGQPLAGVQVSVKGTTIGTLTDARGNYSLRIPPGPQALVFTFIGYRTVERDVTGDLLNVALERDVLELERLVVTGVGQQIQRQRLGVAIASISGEETNRVPTPNVVTAMAGKAPGVQITATSGDPGAASLVLIRGVKTITGSSQPLIVVDGVPVTNEENFLPSSVQYGEATYLAGTPAPNRAIDINPADIESIEVLRGPAAGAVYGARAANGVILITTKRGMAGFTRTTLTTSMALDQPSKTYPLQRRYGQGMGGVSCSSFDVCGFGILRSWGGPITGPSYDHFQDIMETGRMADMNLSIAGGSDRTTYYLSVGVNDHDGYVVGSSDTFKRYSARLKGSHQLAEAVRISGNFAYTESDGNFVQKGSNLSGIMLGGLRTPPDFNNRPYKTSEGFQRSYTNPNPESLYDWWFFDNPLWTIYENQNSSQVSRAFGNTTLEYQPFPWLNLNYTLGIDYSADERMEVMPPGNYTWVEGFLGKADFISHQVNHTALATVERDLSETVAGSFTMGYERNARRYSRYYVEGLNFVVPYLRQLDNTVTRTPDEYRERINAESFYGQAVLDVGRQVFLTGAVRNDGFSTFGSNQKRHWYPKASAAWEFTRTFGIEEHPVLSYGKLRAAYGVAGNEPPAYATLAVYSGADLAEGWNPLLRSIYGGMGSLVTGTTKEQPDIRPEQTKEFEVGADLSLFRQRLGLGVTYYNARTEDAILFSPLPPSTGYFSQLENAATFENKGWEVTGTLRVLETPTVSWEIGANYTANRNNVVSFGDPNIEFISMGGFSGVVVYAVKGEGIGVFRGQEFWTCGNALDPQWNAPSAIRDACQGAPAGAYYIGADGFPVMDPNVRVIGDPNPDWMGGLSTNVTLWRNLRVSGLLDMQMGHDMWNGTKGALYSYGTHADTEVRGLQSTWGAYQGVPTVGPGANQTVAIDQAWFMGLGSGFGPNSAQFVEDAGFIKLREIAVSYSVPDRLASRLAMSGIELRAAGRNLYTWTDYTGLDPETNLTGTLGALRGYDYFNNPQLRQWMFSVSLTR
jgi:TonB-linked SusC/RagA family outer membrane protein